MAKGKGKGKGQGESTGGSFIALTNDHYSFNKDTEESRNNHA